VFVRYFYRQHVAYKLLGNKKRLPALDGHGFKINRLTPLTHEFEGLRNGAVLQIKKGFWRMADNAGDVAGKFSAADFYCRCQGAAFGAVERVAGRRSRGAVAFNPH
jgi:hypothetical protein